MVLSLTDVLRDWFGGNRKEKPFFKTEREAYDFCREAYKKSGGVPEELRRTYEFYINNLGDGHNVEREPFRPRDQRN